MMKKIFDIFKELILIIYESFVYLFLEIKYFILDLYYKIPFVEKKDKIEVEKPQGDSSLGKTSLEELIDKGLKEVEKEAEEQESAKIGQKLQSINDKSNLKSSAIIADEKSDENQHNEIEEDSLIKKSDKKSSEDQSLKDSVINSSEKLDHKGKNLEQNITKDSESKEDKHKLDLASSIKRGDDYLSDDSIVKAKKHTKPLPKKEKEEDKGKKPEKEKKALAHKLSSFFLKLFIFILIMVGIFTIYVLWNLPDYKTLENYNPALTTRVYSNDGYIISEYAIEKRLFVPIDNVPQKLIDAFLSAEDKNFYEHGGIDYLGLLRATFNNVLYLLKLKNNIEGASTITQQVAKNFLLTSDRSIKRKIREAVLTKKIEEQYSKNKILELYLNEIYLGKGSYGVSMAALNYFDKPVSDLTLSESAFLAALPKAPGKYDVNHNYDEAKIRRDWVIGRMLEDGKITKEEAQEAQAEPIVVKERTNLRTIKTSYASEEVRKELIKKFSSDEVYEGGLIVKTTLNYNYQDYAYESLRKGILEYEDRFGYKGAIIKSNGEYNEKTIIELGEDNKQNWLGLLRGKEVEKYERVILPWKVAVVLNVEDNIATVGFKDSSIGTLRLNDNLWAKPFGTKDKQLTSFKKIIKVGDVIFVDNENNKLIIKQIPDINGAIVAMDPQTGDILAMQGGYSFLLSEFNRATQAKRQPGSSLKPLIYLSAIEKGFMTTDRFLDAPYVLQDVGGKGVKKIKNSHNSYRGLITLRYALEWSSNLATIRVANSTGMERISENLKKLGVYDDDIVSISEVLGSKETTLLQMVRAYSILVNGGKSITPNLINLVQDKAGNVLYKRDVRQCESCDSLEWENQEPPVLPDIREQLVDEKDAYIVVNLMQGVVDRGSGTRARVYGYNIGGKTGTSNESKDAWFIGFSPDLVVGVFLGKDIPESLHSSMTASSIVVPIFQSFMQKALKGKESLPFRMPKGVNMHWVEYMTGKDATVDSKRVILDVMKEGQKSILQPDSTENSVSGIMLEEDGIY